MSSSRGRARFSCSAMRAVVEVTVDEFGVEIFSFVCHLIMAEDKSCQPLGLVL